MSAILKAYSVSVSSVTNYDDSAAAPEKSGELS